VLVFLSLVRQSCPGNWTILVGGLEHVLFSIYWECHHPNWLCVLIFYRLSYTESISQPTTFSHFNCGGMVSSFCWSW
jgi:hypothetical protein